MTSQPRPARCIWLTEEDARSHLLYPRWAAAPADSAEAAMRAVAEPGIYVINGQGVCEKHIGAPYNYPEHGFGGMQSRYKVARFNDMGQA